jgi:DNA anti-recombination protein RmuC
LRGRVIIIASQREAEEPKKLPVRETYYRVAKTRGVHKRSASVAITGRARKRAKGVCDNTHTPALDFAAENTMASQTPTEALLQLVAQQNQMQLERWNREDREREDKRREKEQARQQEKRQMEREREQERQQREADREADLRQRQIEFQHLTETMTALTVAQTNQKSSHLSWNLWGMMI